MEYTTETYLVETKQQKLLKNRTVQWFLYGNPNHIDNCIKLIADEFTRNFEQRANNAMLYGTSHPEMYKTD